MASRIVVLDGVTLEPGDNPWTPVESLGELTVYEGTGPDEVVARLEGAEVAVVNKVRLTRQVLERLPDLRFITVLATGYDCVDIRAARERNIPVSNVPTYGTDSVAQYAFAMLLELCHRVGAHDAAVRAGEWKQADAFSFWKTPQIELAGLTLGVIGFGRIGRRSGEIGHAFGMSILANDMQPSNPPAYQPFAWASVEEIAERADAITLHCNLTEEARGMINAEFLARMKPTAMLVNTARGALVDEQALAAALNQGQLAGAALDVVSAEPIRDDNPLLAARNCLLTPHMAWSTLAARKRIMQTTADNIRAYQQGQPQNVVNA